MALAHEQGYLATCVRDLGLGAARYPDHALTRLAFDMDHIIVIANATDFRGGGPQKPGGHYARMQLHPGLVCLVSYRRMSREIQRDMFRRVLRELSSEADWINRVLEVEELNPNEIEVIRYSFPP